ncbi:hypothetical protein [Winogradskyella aurantiaca]|uniref:hypothetical protein n=1 Tax=Winogradskyella aurantiaca TaxID=2219558 RepID=UPI0013006D76|nr:hypothetical protein [Winogradskyella aurantiaca]
MSAILLQNTFRKSPLFLLFLCLSTLSFSQEKVIKTYYDNYASINQEAIYVHLNKSTFIQGEDLGFTAYVFDKKTKALTSFSSNLYLSIEDANQKPIKQMLLHVVDGVASNSVQIDSAFSTGTYILKAYTNWSLNFNEQAIYSEAFDVLNPDEQDYVETELVETEPDAQFLPEGGHLLADVINKVGVIIKDHKGYGIPYATGVVYDSNNKALTDFKVDRMGIGQFSFVPQSQSSYTVKVNCLNETFSYPITELVETNGMVLSLNKVRKRLIAQIATNTESQQSLGNQTFHLAVHNGEFIKLVDFSFGAEASISKGFDLQNLPPGVLVFTILNSRRKPIAERLFFNYNGLKIRKSSDLVAEKNKDSLQLQLTYNTIKPNFFNHVSVSVLPQNTQTYNRHNNIVSSVYLRPYVKGSIERADYYFRDVTPAKEAELDNLLLTQGWSSFDWQDIFKEEHLFLNRYEQGLEINGNVNSSLNKGEKTFLLHSVSGDEPQLYTVSANETKFVAENIFPVGTNTIHFSEITSTGNKSSNLYLQSFPNSIPNAKVETRMLGPKPLYQLKEALNDNTVQLNNPEDLQELDAVVITSRIERKRVRLKKLQKGRYGNVKIIDDNARITFNTIGEFLRYYGLYVDEANGGFRVYNGYSYGLRGNTSANINTISTDAFSADNNIDTGTQPINPGDRNKIMAIYLDGSFMPEPDMLHQFPLLYIDYVEINRRGFGEGFRGAAGVIKIYSNWGSSIGSPYDNSASAYQLPLSFAKEKRFYVPKYRSERDDFYQEYGVVDWKPDARIENSQLVFNIKKPKVPVKLFIEGYLGDGSFISEIKEVSN